MMGYSEALLTGMSAKAFTDELLAKLPDWEQFDQFWEVVTASEVLSRRAVTELTNAVTRAQMRLANENDSLFGSMDPERRRKTRTFIALANERKGRLKDSVHIHSQHGDRVNKAWRDLTKRLVMAIAEHRIDFEESGRRARPADAILWDCLDELSFPNGGPLSHMADIYLAKRDRGFDVTDRQMTEHSVPRRNRGTDSFRPVPS